jgi:hypothetical protein
MKIDVETKAKERYVQLNSIRNYPKVTISEKESIMKNLTTITSEMYLLKELIQEMEERCNVLDFVTALLLNDLKDIDKNNERKNNC